MITDVIDEREKLRKKLRKLHVNDTVKLISGSGFRRCNIGKTGVITRIESWSDYPEIPLYLRFPGETDCNSKCAHDIPEFKLIKSAKKKAVKKR